MKSDVLFALPGILLTVFSWGVYGAVLHKGQHELNGDKLKPLICVGLAYFVVAIIVPTVILAINGKLSGDWSTSGFSWSMAAGVAGACGAFGIILAMTLGKTFNVAGGNPIYIMPLVFGGAPIINVLSNVAMARMDGKHFQFNPVFFAGMALVIVGAALVLVYKPTPKTSGQPAASHAETSPAPAADKMTTS